MIPILLPSAPAVVNDGAEYILHRRYIVSLPLSLFLDYMPFHTYRIHL